MEFTASLESLAEIMSHIRAQAEHYNVEISVIRKIELACEEAVVNIISYAYKKKSGMIHVACDKVHDRFLVTLRDTGVAFNPIDVEIHPQLDAPVCERKIGGMGIYLIRKVIDEVSYQREGDENVLRLAFST